MVSEHLNEMDFPPYSSIANSNSLLSGLTPEEYNVVIKNAKPIESIAVEKEVFAVYGRYTDENRNFQIKASGFGEYQVMVLNHDYYVFYELVIILIFSKIRNTSFEKGGVCV
ncbi:hypothetical protein ACYCS5_16325 [Paenibacillus sp. SEL3]|jgi:hypothetical protein|uniref:Uncharacterized protein n=2 Tax=Paenibacillus polymyxa TaxID=1406 RepID=A0A8I1J3H9_PAEPO|nr:MULTISPECIES: hypothetical protein [unclassified Paenibacillus]KAF6571789.1 hypothetical protein G9G53_16990 [Paenibacillus sp. EKM206P]KAF6586502.1 hypothetical protein G9G52_19995 [Paenibacillus sp. EKM205P]MBM0635145.1 hypothetical protein [Paenibacillus polymyxa]